MSENFQSVPIVVKTAGYKTPIWIWFRNHLLLPLLVIGGLITFYLSMRVNRLALIGFALIMILFLIRPGSEIYHLQHISLQERIFLILRGFGQLILVFGSIILIYLVIYFSESALLGILLVVLFLILIDRLETHRIAKQATRWKNPISSSNQL